MTEQTSLTRRDLWTIARLINAYEMELPPGLTHRGQQLASQLQQIAFRSRDLVLKQSVTTKEYQSILAIDTEASIPQGGDPSKPWRIIHARELKNLPPVVWLIEKEVPQAGLTVLFGESGAGKSFLGVDMALRVAQSRRVVYIPTEGEAGYKNRVAAWCEFHKQNEGDCYFITGTITLFDKEPFNELLNDLIGLRPALVVFDTLALAMAGGDENSARDMGLILSNCRRIIQATGAAVILVHHVGKAGGAERGSSALRGNADVMIRVNPADDLVLVECSKTKDEAPFEPRYVYMLPVGASLVPVPSDAVIRDATQLTPSQRKLLDVLALEVNQDGVSMRDLESLTNISVASVQRSLSNLLKKGLVGKPSGSYAINEAGLKALGRTDPARSTDSHGNDSARSKSSQPMIQGDPRSNGNLSTRNSGSAGSLGSPGSSLNEVDHSGSPEPLFPLDDFPSTKPVNQYVRERQGK